MTFTPDWLALREPADTAARSGRLTQLAGERLLRRENVRVLDLAAGTGANMRYLANRLPSHQTWLLADHDPLLLQQAPGAIQAWAEGQGIHTAAPADSADSLKMSDGATRYEARTTKVDLVDSLDSVLFSGSDLVTASALLDLVSEPWLRMLTRRCREVEAVVLFALSYDGRIDCAPSEVEDDRIRNLVNAHQQTNKGFGPALGPAAAGAAVRLLAEAGYHVEHENSDWMLGPEHRELQQQLIEGWVDAAAVMGPGQNGIIQNWRARRLAHVDAGRSRLIVGHEDVVGWVND